MDSDDLLKNYGSVADVRAFVQAQHEEEIRNRTSVDLESSFLEKSSIASSRSSSLGKIVPADGPDTTPWSLFDLALSQEEFDARLELEEEREFVLRTVTGVVHVQQNAMFGSPGIDAICFVGWVSCAEVASREVGLHARMVLSADVVRGAKFSNKLCVISRFRFWLISRNLLRKLSVDFSGHFYDLRGLWDARSNESGTASLGIDDKSIIVTRFRQGKGLDRMFMIDSLSFCSELFHSIRSAHARICSNTLSGSARDRFKPLLHLGAAPVPMLKLPPTFSDSILPISTAYEAVCNYRSEPYSQAVVMYMRRQKHFGSRVFTLSDCPGADANSEHAFVPNSILAALPFDQWFRALELRDFFLSEPLKPRLLFEYDTTITKLVLVSLEGASVDWIGLAKGLKNNVHNQLQEVDFSNNALTDADIRAFAETFEMLQHGLCAMRLVNCSLKPRGLAALFIAFQRAVRVSQQLRELDVSRNDLGTDGSRALGDWLRSVQGRTRLRRLVLAYANFEVRHLFLSAGAVFWKELALLDIRASNLKGAVDSVIPALFALSRYRSVRLGYLSHISTKGYEKVVSAILESAVSEVSIDLAHTPQLSGMQVKSLIPVPRAGRPHCLTSLDISNCRLGGRQVAALLEISRKRLPTLARLAIGGNCDHCKNPEDCKLVVSALCDMLRTGTAVNRLDIRGYAGQRLGQFLAPLFQLLAPPAHQQLEEFLFDGNHCGDKAFGHFVFAISCHATKLRSVSFDENLLCAESIVALAVAVVGNTTLVHVPVERSKDIAEVRARLGPPSRIMRLRAAIEQIERTVFENLSQARHSGGQHAWIEKFFEPISQEPAERAVPCDEGVDEESLAPVSAPDAGIWEPATAVSKLARSLSARLPVVRLDASIKTSRSNTGSEQSRVCISAEPPVFPSNPMRNTFKAKVLHDESSFDTTASTFSVKEISSPKSGNKNDQAEDITPSETAGDVGAREIAIAVDAHGASDQVRQLADQFISAEKAATGLLPLSGLCTTDSSVKRLSESDTLEQLEESQYSVETDDDTDHFDATLTSLTSLAQLSALQAKYDHLYDKLGEVDKICHEALARGSSIEFLERAGAASMRFKASALAVDRVLKAVFGEHDLASYTDLIESAVCITRHINTHRQTLKSCEAAGAKESAQRAQERLTLALSEIHMLDLRGAQRTVFENIVGATVDGSI